ncbi:MAG TPA: hypothetical protein VF559_07640 [Caulobacteraceae bacterium]|jgi:hypothetical protein
MKFRERGGYIQVRRPTAGEGKAEAIGRIKTSDLIIPLALREKLNSEELSEVEAHLETRKAANDLQQRHAVGALAAQVKLIERWLDNAPPEEAAAAARKLASPARRLGKALKKHKAPVVEA